ncbi:MAG: AI-2E family transporter [Candidatus Cyclobacteriaceae bacterium M2_1C_046]
MKNGKDVVSQSPYLDKQFIVKLVVAILLVFLALAMYELVLKVFQVFLLAFAAVLWAVLFRGPSDYLIKKFSISRKLATFISVVIVLGIIVGLSMFIGPQINKQIPEMQEKIPQAWNDLKSQLQQSPVGERIIKELENPRQVVKDNQQAVTSFIRSFFTSAFGLVADILIIIVIGFFFLANPSLYKNILVKPFPLDKRERAGEVITYQYISLKSWLAGKLFDMLVVSILTTTGLLIMGIPLAFTLGIIAGLLSFIPNLGPLIAQIPALLIAYTVGPQYIFYVFILYNGIQLIESNLLLPLIQQKMVAIPPAIILLSQVLLGIVAGIFGIILAVPLLVVLIVFIKMIYLRDILGDPDVELQAEKG